MSILTCHFRLVSMSQHADVGPAPRVTRHGRDRLRGAGPSLRSRHRGRRRPRARHADRRKSIPTRSGASRASGSSPTSSALAQRAPSISRNELLVGMLRIIASLGPRNGHTGLFPGDPSHTRELHFYPVRLYDFADGMYVVDATDRLARPEPSRGDRGRADRAGPRARRAPRPARQHVEPSRAGAALPAHRRGARRPRSRRRRRSGRASRSSSPTASASTSR